MPIPKAALSSDWSLQPDSTKLDSLVIAHQPRRGEYDDPADPRYLITRRGAGYYFNKE